MLLYIFQPLLSQSLSHEIFELLNLKKQVYKTSVWLDVYDNNSSLDKNIYCTNKLYRLQSQYHITRQLTKIEINHFQLCFKPVINIGCINKETRKSYGQNSHGTRQTNPNICAAISWFNISRMGRNYTRKQTTSKLARATKLPRCLVLNVIFVLWRLRILRTVSMTKVKSHKLIVFHVWCFITHYISITE